MDHTFIAAWDQSGIESLFEVDELRFHQDLIDILADNKPKKYKLYSFELNSIVRGLILRANMNSHRYYEIYSITTNESIDYSNMLSLFKDSPQLIVDLIREKGNKIYSNRRHEDDIKII